MIRPGRLAALLGRTVSGVGFVDPRTGHSIPAEESHPGVSLTFGAVVVSFVGGEKMLLTSVVGDVEELSVDLDWRGNSVIAPGSRFGVVDRVGVARDGVSALSTRNSLWSLCLGFTESDAVVCVCLADLDAQATPTYMPDSICVIESASLARRYRAYAGSGSAYGLELNEPLAR